MVDLNANKSSPPKRDKFILKRSFKDFHQEFFLQDLLKQEWDSQVFADPSVSIHEKSALFDKIFENCLDRHAPVEKIKIHKNYRRGIKRNTKTNQRKGCSKD